MSEKQVPQFGFLKDNTDVCARPLLATNIMKHPGASSPVICTRAGEWAFVIVDPSTGCISGNGPWETEADAFRGWVDFMTYTGDIPVLPLISVFEHSPNQDMSAVAATGKTDGRGNNDFEQFMEGLI